MIKIDNKNKKQIDKVIELEDQFINHQNDQPYIQSCKKDKYILFILHSIKIYKYQPVLLLDHYQQHDLQLPLNIGTNITQLTTYSIIKGQFQQDGTWYCKHQFKKPGVFNFQLVFLDYGDIIVKDTGSFDCVVFVQSKIQLRKLRNLTIFPRCIGTITDWSQFLKNQVQLGYNSFHFAPIQQTGQSKSYYSIYNQLQLSTDIFPNNKQTGYEQLHHILTKYQQQGIIFFIDIVLNHTSINSDWIKCNQNTIFNIYNTPILKSAYQLDYMLQSWGNKFIKQKVSAGRIQMNQIQYQQVKNQLKQLVNSVLLHQFFQIGQKVIQQFITLAQKDIQDTIQINSQFVFNFIQLNCQGLGQNRKGVQIYDLKTKWQNVSYKCGVNDIRNGIDKFNKKWQNIIKNQWIEGILTNLLAEIKYNYLTKKIKKYTDPTPFINSYFTRITFNNGKQLAVLKNGWIMLNSNQNMVQSKNFYYLRRMVSIWNDLIRIRYGKNQHDSYSWIHIKKYLKIMSLYFDGFRLDNFHNTEIQVGSKLIKYIRKQKPQIIIFAQLFTKQQQQKNKYLRLSGINSLLTQLQYFQTGQTYIKLYYQQINKFNQYTGSINPYFIHYYHHHYHYLKFCQRKKPILLLYDLTHDNKTYQEKDIAIKKLPIVLLTQFCGTFIGSTKGFDQFYYKKINVTSIQALYKLDLKKQQKQIHVTTWLVKFIFQSNNQNDHILIMGSWNGWSQGKVMNFNGQIGFQVDIELGKGYYQYKYIKNGQWITDPNKQTNNHTNHELTLDGNQKKSIYSTLQQLRSTCSLYRQKYWSYNQYFLYCDGDIVVLVRQKKITRDAVCVIVNLSKQKQKLSKPILLPGKMQRSDIWMIQSIGPTNKSMVLDVNIVNSSQIRQHFDLYFNPNSQKDVLLANDIPPGFGCIIACDKSSSVQRALQNIKLINLNEIKIPPLGPLDYNLIMYGVQSQQQIKFNSSNFYLPSSKSPLIFGGFAGIINQIEKAKRYNNLSSAVFNTIREGNWLVDYYVGRLKRFKTLYNFTNIVQQYFTNLKNIPNYLQPKYFTDFIYIIYIKIQQSISQNITNKFHKMVLMATTQFISNIPTTNNLFTVTVSAGIPNYTIGSQRCFGRTTFQSNELLLLYPNIYYDTILQFASVLRHGNIPNIINFGINPRYNCRDVCWWFIRSVKQYARFTSNYQIFKTNVNLIYLSNDQVQHKQKINRRQTNTKSIQDIIQNIFQSHINTIKYHQWNAGNDLDINMVNKGFDVILRLDQKTGFIAGGNQKNGLTWMNKIGCSEHAKNKGFPTSSRAGAPIQLTALLYHCLVQYDRLNKQGYYGYSGVKLGTTEMSFSGWAEKIKQNFESQYWIQQKKNPIKYKNIYKDFVLGPPILANESCMLRPNALIALAIAPELVVEEHALEYLSVVQKQLISKKSIGVSTLSKAHNELYVGSYERDNDSNDFKIAKGFSQYNGPEWVWLYGFYVKAKCNFTKGLKKQQLFGLLQNHKKYIENNEWRSLPQFTNINGENNQYSCRSSLSAISSMLLAIQAIQKYQG